MKTVAIVGSPRKGGNCDILVNELAEKLEGEKKIYYLNEIDMNYCEACQKCQTGDCVQDDDINKIVDEMMEADLFIFSSPIYYGQMTAQAKTLVDRFYQVSQNPNKSLEGTKVVQIFTQANPTEAFDAYIDSMKTMPFGYVGMDVIDTVVARGAMGKGENDQLASAIEQIEKIGNDLL
ncbi:MAG: flavodoxin family protein [Methanobrevibacter sp.]|uniref:flavodoxin family protein n=1 Tax=Methanobrevibacter sp. TaxID=66852 RepID=UPI0026E04530|nr:flavodoxin family protein [Methanobrevibacter sp.]MDO5849086.1 flavodoxin family protein [Methanobrevibacter sp.]